MSEDEIHLEEGFDDIIEYTSGDDDLITFGFYSQLKIHKEYCSSMQNKCKFLTSTWVLASFMGMGFLLSGHESIVLPFNIILGIVLLSVFSFFGITLIWFLDVVLYQNLSMAVTVELACLEQKHAWIPKVYLDILALKNRKSGRVYHSFFYIGVNFIFMFIAAVALIYYYAAIAHGIVISLLFMIFAFFVARLMLNKSGEKEIIDLNSFT